MVQQGITHSQLQGVGLGLRPSHYKDLLSQPTNLPWLEILGDNYLVDGGPLLDKLDQIKQLYPLAMHCVGMSLGSTDPLNWAYLQCLKSLAERSQAVLISDHLCWVSAQQQNLHELLPLPYTEEAITHVATRINQVQDFLGRQILIENVSSYLSYKDSSMPEWEFLNAVATEADCLILLDINNIYVSARNHGFAAEDYLQAVDRQRVAQFHLAGYEDCNSYYLDSHGTAVHPPVWELYRQALNLFGAVPTLLERDNDIPSYTNLLSEVQQAQSIMDEICQQYES